MRIALTLASLAAAALVATTAAYAAGNPASAYCESRGGTVETVPGANGGERGICVLPSGTRVDQWVLFRNTHRTTH